MNIRQAILKAADRIETNPHLFAFSQTRIPECGSPGCALGWIGFYAGAVGNYEDVAREVLKIEGNKEIGPGSPHWIFYGRIEEFVPCTWTMDSALCVQGLRAYADKYHPEPIKVPDWEALAKVPVTA